MTNTQHRVTTKQSLNLRASGAGSVAPIVASLKPGVIVHVTGDANPQGYAPAFVFGWLGTDGRTVFSDSYQGESSVDAVLLPAGKFEPQGAQDVYGRQPGVVKGWAYLAYLERLA